MKSNTAVSSKHRNKELLLSSKGFNLGCWKNKMTPNFRFVGSILVEHIHTLGTSG